MGFADNGLDAQVEAYETESLDRYPPDEGAEIESETDEHGRLVRRWTSKGRRIEEIIALAPAPALDSLRVLGGPDASDEPG